MRGGADSDGLRPLRAFQEAMLCASAWHDRSLLEKSIEELRSAQRLERRPVRELRGDHESKVVLGCDERNILGRRRDFWIYIEIHDEIVPRARRISAIARQENMMLGIQWAKAGARRPDSAIPTPTAPRA